MSEPGYGRSARGVAVPGRAGARIDLLEFAAQYSAALQAYCDDEGEAALFQAYELGRGAANEGRSALEMAAVHHEALAASLLTANAVDERTRIARRASELFAECLAPFDLSRLVYQEQRAKLCALKQGAEPPAAGVAGDDALSEERVHRPLP